MGRILLQLTAIAMALVVALFTFIHRQPAEGVVLSQLQPTASTDITEPCLPYTVPGTGLVVESLTSYDGSFVEDGLEAQVSNVATVMLHNTGPAVTWTQVMIQTNGGVLTFCASMLPAGSRVMVLERDARRYPVGALTACRGQAVLAEESWMDEARLQFADIDMGTMAVTNLTDSPIKNLLIYYKTHYGDVDIFLGGVTYFHKVEALDGGETVLIQPDHYAKGYSQIVRVSME